MYLKKLLGVERHTNKERDTQKTCGNCCKKKYELTERELVVCCICRNRRKIFFCAKFIAHKNDLKLGNLNVGLSVNRTSITNKTNLFCVSVFLFGKIYENC